MLSHATHPEPPMSPPLSPLYRVNFSPQKRRPEHARHGSEVIQRPRPLSIMDSPSKRSSVYVSEASVLFARRSSVVSPVSPYKGYESLLSPAASTVNGSDAEEFVDHYAILELDSRASAEQIKAAYRRLRMVYFQSNAIKYRALCAAFDVLADPEAREEYDATYPSHAAGSTAPTSPRPRSSLGVAAEKQSSKHGRKDSGQHSTVSTLVEEFEAASTIYEETTHAAQEEMPPVQEEEEQETRDPEDPNWGLKRHCRLHEPLIGTQPYQSFVPILQVYESRTMHPMLRCRRPAYTGCQARNALPA